MAHNIDASETGPIWNDGDVPGSLTAIVQYVEAEAAKSVKWYWERKQTKAYLSRSIQFSAITLTALAALVPVVGALVKDASNNSAISPLWASLFVGIAAALLGLDRAFGFSSGWARYVLAATAIRGKLEEFRMDWLALGAGGAKPPSAEQLTVLIQRAKEFRLVVEDVVTQETKDWVAEFQNSLAQLEKDAKAQLEVLHLQVEKAQQAQLTTNQLGSMEITVPNADKMDGFAFTITVQGTSGQAANEVVTGSKIWSRIGLRAGDYLVAITATSQQKPVSSSAIVTVAGNQIARKDVALPP